MCREVWLCGSFCFMILAIPSTLSIVETLQRCSRYKKNGETLWWWLRQEFSFCELSFHELLSTCSTIVLLDMVIHSFLWHLLSLVILYCIWPRFKNCSMNELVTMLLVFCRTISILLKACWRFYNLIILAFSKDNTYLYIRENYLWQSCLLYWSCAAYVNEKIIL